VEALARHRSVLEATTLDALRTLLLTGVGAIDLTDRDDTVDHR